MGCVVYGCHNNSAEDHPDWGPLCRYHADSGIVGYIHYCLCGSINDTAACYSCEAGLCSDCGEETGSPYRDACGDCAAGELLQSYDYQPEWEIRSVGREAIDYDTPLLGVEIEVEAGYEQAEVAEAANQYDLFFTKHDGSLNSGVEIVSHPMTFRYVRERFPYQLLADVKRAGGIASPGTCGIHIHLSRAAFTTYHMYRFLHFHFDPQLQELAMMVAGRNSDQWASWSINRFTDEYEGKLVADKLVRYARKKDTPYQRYVAVNLSNDDTVELRYFAPTLRVERLQRRLEWAMAVFDYTSRVKVHSRSNNLGIEGFAHYVQSNRRRYSVLNAWLKAQTLPGTNRHNLGELGVTENLALRAERHILEERE